MEDKIIIAFVAASTHGGGAEKMLLNIMHSLSPLKYELHFMNTSTEPKPKSLQSHIKYYQYNKLHAKSAFFELTNELKVIQPQYIFTTSIVVAYLLQAIRALNRLKSKLFVRISVPPSELPHKGIKPFILKKINSNTLKKADLIIAQTEFSKHDIVKNYNVQETKVKVIRNIVDKPLLKQLGDDFEPKELEQRHKNIVAAGALYSVKGFDLLIAAMEKVVELNPEVRLYILGTERYEHGYKETLQNQITTLNLEKHIFLLGHKENPYPYYKKADLFVLSSRKEGFPNVVLESLYYGTPVVATDCVDFTEVIQEGKNGFIVAKNKRETLTDGILKALAKLKRSSENSLENFNYENIFK